MSETARLEVQPCPPGSTPAVSESRDRLCIRRFRSTDDLRANAEAWNRLWDASTTSIGSLRAEAIALWCDTFAHGDALDAWLVEVDDRPVAAMPLVRQRVKGLVCAHTLPTNPHLSYAAPLVDQSLPRPASAVGKLLEQIVGCPDGSTLLWLEQAAYTQPAWVACLDSARQLGLHVSVRHHYDVGRTVLAESWDEFERQMKKRHRQNMRRHRKRAQESCGPLSLEIVDPSACATREEAVRLVFEVEARSWKGESGTAVLQSPAVLEYFQRLAEITARSGQLGVCFLKAGDKPIAAVYGFISKGTFYLVKLGCDDSLRKFGPGQLLVYLLVQAAHDRPEIREINFFGEMSDYQKYWVSHTDPVGRVVIARRGLKPGAVFGFYEHVAPTLKRVGAWRPWRTSVDV